MTFRTGALRLAYAERSKTYVYSAVRVLGTLYLAEGWGESGVTGNRKFCRIRSRLVGKPLTIAEIPPERRNQIERWTLIAKCGRL